MAGNTFGRIFRLTTFGESHGCGIGGVLDGCPAGLSIDEEMIQKELDLRKPGAGLSASKRKESDRVKILSGLLDGVTTGTPIGFYIENEDYRSRDYGNLAEVFRPSHADWGYFHKYRGVRDYRGGGRSSARETAIRVAAGAVAKQLLARIGNVRIMAGAIEMAGHAVAESEIELGFAATRPFFAASSAIVPIWEEEIKKASARGDTLGGIVRIVAENVPAGLGEPVFDKLDAVLAHALMSVGAVKGVEVGSGFEAARMPGSLHNDGLRHADTPMLGVGGMSVPCCFASNNAGGIAGGISTGQPIVLQAAVKPIASLGMEQETVDKNGNCVKISIGGRHDLSAIPRIVPVLSAMTALTLADAWLLQTRMTLVP